MISKKTKIIKTITLFISILLIIYLLIKLVPLFTSLLTEEGRVAFKENIEGLGIEGVFVLFGLMFAQVLIAILPGEPIELLAGMCYGPLWGTLIILFGAFVSSVVIFFAVRKLGRKFIYNFAEKEKIDKLEKSKWFANEKRLEIIFLILFLIPGTPKDLLVYIGGLLPVKPLKFILISTFARFPSIISSTAIGNSIVDGNWLSIIAIIGVTVLITGSIVWIIRKRDKKLADDILNNK